MKRGFLNSKKAKDQLEPLHNNGAVGHSKSKIIVPCIMTFSNLNTEAVQGILAKPAEPYAVIHFPSLELTQEVSLLSPRLTHVTSRLSDQDRPR